MSAILRLLATGQAAPGNPYGASNPAVLMGVRNSFGICFKPGTSDEVDSLEVFYQPDQFDPILDLTVGPEEWLWFTTRTSIMRIRPPDLSSVDDRPRLGTMGAVPNPFQERVTLSFPPGSSVRHLEILDLGGRRIRAWTGLLADHVAWDGFDAAHRPVPPGIYLVRARTAAGFITRRIVRQSRQDR
jgi:hypothetical protein